VTPDSRATGSNTKIAYRTDAIATAGLCTVIALAPLPFGSTDPGVIAVWVLVLSASVALASLRAFSSRDVVILASFAIVALCWAFVVIEQMSRAPLLAGLINPIWPQTSALLGYSIDGFITLARDQPYFSAGSQIACMLSMVGGFLVGRDRRAAYLLLQTFAGSGLIYAIYGIVAFVFWPDYLLWQHKFGYENALIATFTNPNVAAVYFGACTIAWLLMLAKTLRAARSWRDLADALFRHPSRRTVTGFAASFIVLSAMFMTGSRAGSMFTLLAVSGAAATLFRQTLGTRGLLLAFPISAACGIVAALQIFGGRIDQRFGAEGLFDSGRWNTYLSTLGIIGDHPWLGTGLGTFRWAFPRYRSEYVPMSGIWAQAHSSPLEIASETGIPFTVLVVAGWLSIFMVLAKGMLGRKRDEILPLAAFWIGLVAVVHSQIDFSLQIPGFSIPICALVGMGLAQAISSRGLNLTTKQ
jgi:O-Antigen ligase